MKILTTKSLVSIVLGVSLLTTITAGATVVSEESVVYTSGVFQSARNFSFLPEKVYADDLGDLGITVEFMSEEDILSTYAQIELVEEEEEVVEEPIMNYTQAEKDMLAKLVWGEARGVPTDVEKEAVVWCVLNRVDSPTHPDTITGVVTQPNQFTGYSSSFPVEPHIMELVEKALYSYEMEKQFGDSSGRVLPKEYIYFGGSNGRNWFRTTYQVTGQYYNFT